jgi:hypothetical protein
MARSSQPHRNRAGYRKSIVGYLRAARVDSAERGDAHPVKAVQLDATADAAGGSETVADGKLTGWRLSKLSSRNPPVSFRPKHEPAPRDWCCAPSHTQHPNHRPMRQSKVGALPQTPPGAEPLDLNT